MKHCWEETPPGSGNWVCALGRDASVVVFRTTRATPTLEALTAWTYKIEVSADDDHCPHKTKAAAQSAALRAVHKFAVGLAAATVAAMDADEGKVTP